MLLSVAIRVHFSIEFGRQSRERQTESRILFFDGWKCDNVIGTKNDGHALEASLSLVLAIWLVLNGRMKDCDIPLWACLFISVLSTGRYPNSTFAAHEYLNVHVD
jgi:hypothetical protein